MLSVLVWLMVGLAMWHFAVLVPDRFWGGIIGACAAAIAGAAGAGFLLPAPGVNAGNPPGLGEVTWPALGAALFLVGSYWHGARVEDRREALRDVPNAIDAATPARAAAQTPEAGRAS